MRDFEFIGLREWESLEFDCGWTTTNCSNINQVHHSLCCGVVLLVRYSNRWREIELNSFAFNANEVGEPVKQSLQYYSPSSIYLYQMFNHFIFMCVCLYVWFSFKYENPSHSLALLIVFFSHIFSSLLYVVLVFIFI